METPPNRVRIGTFEFDLKAGELRDKVGMLRRLQEQPFQILLMLVERSGGLVTREEIQRKLWPNDTVVEFDHSVHTAINKLRQAFGDSAGDPKYIETVARRGYRLMVLVERFEPTPANPPQAGVAPTPAREAPVSSLSGKKVSHYRVLEVLGGGGMGVVYQAEDLKLGRRVALKFLPEEIAADAKALERFEREARAASALDHPNICTIHEFGEHEGRPFIVMTLLEGQTLRDRIAATAGPFVISEVLRLSTQIADGLAAAHEKSIIHRDIKPANIFITNRDQAKILDFGLAKRTDAVEREASHHEQPRTGTARDLGLSLTGVAIGTVPYMSPEQVRGEKLDPRSDLFSFGLVMYEMATGKRAFPEDAADDIHEAILHRPPIPAREQNPAIPPRLEELINKALEKDRDARCQSAAELMAELIRIKGDTESSPQVSPPPLPEPKALPKPSRAIRTRLWAGLLAAALLLLLAVGVTRYLRKPPPLHEADLILISDFANATGEPIFDGTLKQALTVKMAESPFFNVVLDAQTRKTLGLMERSPDERVLGPLAREVCQREGAKALIGGSILRLGSKYVLDLNAANCLTGAGLAEERIEAASQEQVLGQLGQAIVPIRRKLGESLSSIQRFDTPIEQATTKSLAALKAYTEGDQKRAHGLDSDSVPFYKMAIELDPEFAIAYARLGAVYNNLEQAVFGDEYLRKAFERRGHLSEREKFYVQAHYYEDSTGEIDKAIETYELWTKVYPHDWIPFNNLANDYLRIGNADAAVTAGQQALRLNPNHGFPYSVLALAYQWANRFAEAKAVGEKAKASKLDNWTLRRVLYVIALMEKDEQSAQRESDWAKGNPLEGLLIYQKAMYLLSLGQVREARGIFDRAHALALERQPKELAAALIQDEAQDMADLGFSNEARTLADTARSMLPTLSERNSFTALALARAGDSSRAGALAEEGAKARPTDLLANNVTIASVRAAIQMNRKNPAGAIGELQRSAPYDFSDSSKGMTAYYRGYAYLQMHSGKEAAAEFQRVVDHPGVASYIYAPLAQLGLARAYALTGDRDKSLAGYREFLELWKDADPDVPILKEAKAEYAKLQ